MTQLIGLKIESDQQNYDSIRSASITRHPHQSSYITDAETVQLTDAESIQYGRLNDQLHEAMLATVQFHFSDIEVPKSLRDGCGSGTPFTYQNWDWFGPSYECELIVWEDYVSAKLLRDLQLLLVADLSQWCIMLSTTHCSDFLTQHELASFDDAVLVSESTSKALGMASTQGKAS